MYPLHLLDEERTLRPVETSAPTATDMFEQIVQDKAACFGNEPLSLGKREYLLRTYVAGARAYTFVYKSESPAFSLGAVWRPGLVSRGPRARARTLRRDLFRNRVHLVTITPRRHLAPTLAHLQTLSVKSRMMITSRAILNAL